MTIARQFGVVAFVAGLLALSAAGPAAAQEADSVYQGDIRDIRIGLTADDFPDGYYDPACGTNGGPPSTLLSDWTDFAICRPEPNGFYEVYFTFDDELAQMAAANPIAGMNEWVQNWSGTVVAGFPVIISVLFDDEGVVRGVRVVTDSRAGPDARGDAYLFRIPIMRRFGAGAWECVDLPLENGETPVGNLAIKQRCVKHFPDRTMVMEAHLFRRAGQRGVDPAGNVVPADFDSSTRLEIWDATVSADIDFDGVLEDLSTFDRPQAPPPANPG
ncbi:MAG: hypothetical protein KIS96_09435 [Bauldia sp.]|nr:hypothetical protein [Bauldia sp.]